MSRESGKKEYDFADQTAALLSAFDANSSGGGGSIQLPPYAPDALQSLSGNQLSFVDPNSMMMSNAAATIAAVAASVQQLNQGGSGASSVASGNACTSTSPSMLASLRNAVTSQDNSNSSLHPQLAAMFAAAIGGGQQGLQHQRPASVPSNLQHVLSQQDASKPQQSVSQSVPFTNTLEDANTPASGMQTWTLKQLEKHVSLLRQMKQPVPQSVALLLADAQRKEKKKTAKRAANRKSASTSRARKKALVEEMTLTNGRLKRQALILSLLPDLVVATSLDGEITFCSAQVERILGHNADDLVGVQLDQLLVPSSREDLRELFKGMLHPKKSRSSRQSARRRGTNRRQIRKECGENSDDRIGGLVGKERNDPAGRGGSSQSRDENFGNNATHSAGAAIISEQSFPLSVVEVESKRGEKRLKETQQSKNEDRQTHSNENSDNSTSNISGSNNSGSKQHISSLSNATGLSPTQAEQPFEDDRAQRKSGGLKRSTTENKGKRISSNDDSSSLSSDAKNMGKANDNLDRNVRWHNQRLMVDGQQPDSESGPKDDVTGASVTANNASARLSSLKHVPSPTKTAKKSSNNYENDQSSSDDSLLAGVEENKKVGSASDDSGYRESNDSREESSSSSSDSSDTNKRRKHLAPTCRLLLVRSDLSTVWCEVTSTLRTRSIGEETMDLHYADLKSGESTSFVEETKDVHEFLLCFRPMRDGDKKAGESLRLKTASGESQVDTPVSSGNSVMNVDSEKMVTDRSASTPSEKRGSKRPPKKRHLDAGRDQDDARSRKKSKRADYTEQDSETEKSVVESLMLMNKSP